MKVTRQEVKYYEEEIPSILGDFHGWQFTSGGVTGQDFKVFARLFKREIKRQLPDGAELVNCSSGHYILSGFVKKDGQHVYFSISDVRFFPGSWHKDILIRTAEHEKDYTGGSNCSTSLDRFWMSASHLLS